MVNTPLGVRTIEWLKVKGKDTQVLTYVGPPWAYVRGQRCDLVHLQQRTILVGWHELHMLMRDNYSEQVRQRRGGRQNSERMTTPFPHGR